MYTYRTAITISVENAFPKALVVYRGLSEHMPKIASLGYDGIELALWRKDAVDISALKKLLNETHLELPVISTGQIFTIEKAWFTHQNQHIRTHAVNLMKGLAELASEFGADLNISRVRGFKEDHQSEKEAFKFLTDCLVELARYCEPLGVTLLLEQMNMFETNMLHSVEEVGDYIKSLSIPNLRIHADSFHMNIHDNDMCEVLEKYSNLIGYMHFADSNRRFLGSGHIDFPSIVKTLDSIGYNGWIGIEVLQYPDADTAAKNSILYLKQLISPL